MKKEQLAKIEAYVVKVNDWDFEKRCKQMETLNDMLVSLKRSLEKKNNVRRMKIKKQNKEHLERTGEENDIEYVYVEEYFFEKVMDTSI